VLVGGFATLPRAAVAQVDPILSTLEDPIDEGFVRAFQEGTLARPAPPGFLDAVVRESLKVPARVWRAAWAGIRDEDLTAVQSRIGAPTLAVWGDRDHLCPRASQDALVAAIPGARLSVYEGAGHAPHWEEPERFAAELATLARTAFR
jgi:pimeloyl-ACP methyl ester carboxylesterase